MGEYGAAGRGCFSALLVALLISLSSPSFAVQPDEILKDPALEARARSISKELRCLVCQNQSIDDSDAAVAKDLRLLVRERLQAGDTDLQVFEAITKRFGNFVLLDPPFNAATWVMWLFPFAVLIAGGAVAAVTLRRKSEEVAEISDEDQARVKDYLEKS